MKLSVVVPVYNEAATIAQIIERIRTVTVDKEIVVVDDCSHDGTRQVLETLPDAPDLAAGDRGFSSARNEQAAVDRGVRRVVLQRPGAKSPARRTHERQRWFRRGQRWRVGCEGRISVLKRRHGLRRCRYHGVAGMHRWVGFGVIADNLMNIATFTKARATA